MEVPTLPPNSILCTDCGVPVGVTEVVHHEKGRAHTFKSSMEGLTKVCNKYFKEDRIIQHIFSSHFQTLIKQLPPIPDSMVSFYCQYF